MLVRPVMKRLFCIKTKNDYRSIRSLGLASLINVFSSFSSRSYPPVRKRTGRCGMNMSTNIALKTRTRCYSFDQYVRKCNDNLVVNMMSIIFPDRVVSSVLLLLCETSCPPQQQEQGLPAAVPGLGTTDVKLHCCCWCCSSVLLLLWFEHTHAHKNRAYDLWVEGIHSSFFSRRTIL